MATLPHTEKAHASRQSLSASSPPEALLLPALTRLPAARQPHFAQQRGVKQTKLIKESVTGRYLALLIGNNDYRHWHPLKTAVHDAEALASLLTSKYDYPAHEVRLLRNATRIQMLDGIDWLQQFSGPDDHVLIYYAGHGEYDKNEDG